MGRMARKAAATKGWPDRLFIDGQWREGAAEARMTVVNPATGMPLGSVARAEPADVDRAVAAAQRAFRDWKRLPGAQRGAFLAAIADGLEARRETLIHRQQLNSGKPFGEAEIDIGDAIATYRYYAGLAAGLDARQGEGVALPEPALRGYSRFEPLGVAGLIVPWNFPMVTSAWKVAPALAAGCTVVLKPSEYTPFNELALAEAAEEAGLPAGVLNIVTGATECGAALTHHPGIAKLSFTGSNAVGARIMDAAAARCLPISLELGGKSPIVVFEDVDLDEAAETVAAGIFFNAGQVCSATSRLIVARPVADALRDRLRAIAETLPVGDPLDPATRMGPLTTNAQYGKVQAYFAAARTQGLVPLAGGRARPGDGHFVDPTIYWDVPAGSSLWREEIFGPVLCARSFDTEAEAIALANDSPFGLAAAVLSRDEQRADRVAAELEAGHIWVNTPQVVFPQGAWGGFKASGIGRELGPWGLSAYLGVKHVTARR